MPDKRDMHKAKSHRNSKSSRQHEAPERRADAPPATTTTMTEFVEPTEMPATEPQGKRNKSRR